MKRTTWYAAAQSFLDPYEQWKDSNYVDPAADQLNPILTVHPVDEPPTVPVPLPETNTIGTKVYDESRGSVISAVTYTH
jgi:hypothetical protein